MRDNMITVLVSRMPRRCVTVATRHNVPSNTSVDVGPKLPGIDGRKPPPPLQQLPRGQGSARQWSKLCDWLAVPGNDQRLAGGDALEDLAPVVAKVPHCHLGHRAVYHR